MNVLQLRKSIQSKIKENLLHFPSDVNFVLSVQRSSLQASSPIAEITNEDSVPEYTSFNYWRTPLAEVVPDADGASSKKSKSEETTEYVKCSSEKDGDGLNDVEDIVLSCGMRNWFLGI